MPFGTDDNLLSAIYALGEQMLEALSQQQQGTFLSLFAQRGALLEDLQAFSHPDEVTPHWQQQAAALAKQHRHLMDAVGKQEQLMAEAMAGAEQNRQAHQSYHQKTPLSSILHPDLRG
jgi:hypothetical protein